LNNENSKKFEKVFMSDFINLLKILVVLYCLIFFKESKSFKVFLFCKNNLKILDFNSRNLLLFSLRLGKDVFLKLSLFVDKLFKKLNLYKCVCFILKVLLKKPNFFFKKTLESNDFLKKSRPTPTMGRLESNLPTTENVLNLVEVTSYQVKNLLGKTESDRLFDKVNRQKIRFL
jgi:hypothetical protein